MGGPKTLKELLNFSAHFIKIKADYKMATWNICFVNDTLFFDFCWRGLI